MTVDTFIDGASAVTVLNNIEQNELADKALLPRAVLFISVTAASGEAVVIAARLVIGAQSPVIPQSGVREAFHYVLGP